MVPLPYGPRRLPCAAVVADGPGFRRGSVLCKMPSSSGVSLGTPSGFRRGSVPCVRVCRGRAVPVPRSKADRLYPPHVQFIARRFHEGPHPPIRSTHPTCPLNPERSPFPRGPQAILQAQAVTDSTKDWRQGQGRGPEQRAGTRDRGSGRVVVFLISRAGFLTFSPVRGKIEISIRALLLHHPAVRTIGCKGIGGGASNNTRNTPPSPK